jgi:S-formylglutathione hydrolase FrmB
MHSNTNRLVQHRRTSPYMAGTNRVEVLLPDGYDPARTYRVLYVLPVEERESHRFGDGLMVIRNQGLQNKYGLIVVAPTFDRTPWYGNHATDSRVRYEDYVVRDLVPFIEKNYTTPGTPDGRLLLGFSKSGWGAFTLILRNPDVFGYAASWDAPLMMTGKQFGSWGTDSNFGTAENMALYLPTELIRKAPADFKAKTRLVLAGKDKFGTLSDKRFPYDGPSHTEAFHDLMEKQGILHLYNADLPATHSWNPTWVKPVVEMLMSLADKDKQP